MTDELTPDELRGFSDEIAELFNAGKIPYPVHLSDGNEARLIAIFSAIGPKDWVFGSWRMHYHALLKGVSRETLKAAILRGESMALRFPDQRVFGSAIVGGSVPIALGAALGIKWRGVPGWVWCFMGDMTGETGIAHECMKYARNYNLPIRFIIEDNGVSVCTDTHEAWGGHTDWSARPDVIHYRYQSKYPHAGAGHRVQF